MKKPSESKILPGPTPEGPSPKKAEKPPKTREYHIGELEGMALQAAHENRVRAANEQRGAEEKFVDILEKVLERLGDVDKTKIDPKTVTNIDFKKKRLTVALPEEKKPEEEKKP